MNKIKLPSKILDKRIPTILGIIVLVVALISGTLLIGKGGGVFAPRASEETTPKNIKLSNIHDSSFTVSFLTDLNSSGFVKYGTEENNLKSQASDDRDQISGTIGEFKIHHITIRGLQQGTTYYYLIGTGSGNTFDDGGKPFRIKTATRNGAPAAAKTIYGSITTETGAPAEGSIVYVDVSGAGTMSSQVKASGSWAIPLSNARTIDGNAYAVISDNDNVSIFVQGAQASQKSFFTTTVLYSQPVAGIVFGQETLSNIPNNDSVPSESIREPVEPLDKISDEESAKNEEDSSRAALLENLLKENVLTDEDSSESAVTELDLDLESHQTVTTSTPTIKGKALPGVTISISVHSETEIQQDIVADENGEFLLDISALSENLEPGQHTVTYSYTDPDTGELIEKIVKFTVADTSNQLALADTADKSIPYGSGNPYPIDGAKEASESSKSADASGAAEASNEARSSSPSTEGGLLTAGSVGTTMSLVLGGLFFIIAGLWSFWISTQLEKGKLVV